LFVASGEHAVNCFRNSAITTYDDKGAVLLEWECPGELIGVMLVRGLEVFNLDVDHL
jgi:hypothetical protein